MKEKKFSKKIYCRGFYHCAILLPASCDAGKNMILTYKAVRLKKNLPKYRWQHLKKRGAELF
jgi:hypothetical protein